MTNSGEIHPSILGLAMDIDLMKPLEKNPRIGNVESIVASYKEFGQIKPIVVMPSEDGKYSVIAGNHQLIAARKLGWKKIAAIVYEVDEKRGYAFALADNRTTELGNTDQEVVLELMSEISLEYQDLLLGLGWDEFEVASIETDIIVNDRNDNRGGYTPAVIVNPFDPRDDNLVVETKGEDGGVSYAAAKEMDKDEAVTRGSAAVGVRGGERAIVQYTLVFDDSEQQKRWYDFIRYVRNDPAYVGETTASKLIDFINTNAEF